jgi:hypothetical protein
MGVRIAAVAMACCAALPRLVSGAESGAIPTHACVRLQDRNERLDCYDAVFGRPAAEASPRPEPALAANADANFGLTQQQIDSKASGGASAKSDRVTSEVVALKRDRDGRFTVTLQNGQVWDQIEIQSIAKLATGDLVTIRRASMGSFLLVTPNGVATRVKRID